MNPAPQMVCRQGAAFCGGSALQSQVMADAEAGYGFLSGAAVDFDIGKKTVCEWCRAAIDAAPCIYRERTFIPVRSG